MTDTRGYYDLFTFNEDGADLLNYIADVVVDRSNVTAEEIREFTEDIDGGELWERFCAPSVDALEDAVLEWLDSRKATP